MAHDILIVDDEADIRLLVGGLLNDEGYQTRDAADADAALEAIGARRPSLVLLDIWLQGSRLDGLALLPEIKRDHPDVPVVMMTGHGTVETAVTAMKQGAYEFIEKPFQSDRLLLVIERAIESARMRREIEDLRRRAGVDDEIHRIRRSATICASRSNGSRPPGRASWSRARRARARRSWPRMLHRLSKRAQGPIVVVNCAAMHPERMEIELFGIDAAADGGETRIGTFEQAHGGTLVLDEVADMPLETQGKIVRALQEQTFERVGGGRVEVDVRVDRHQQPRPDSRDRRRTLPRGFVLSPQCVPLPRAAVARTPRGRAGAGTAISCTARPKTAGVVAAHAGRGRHGGAAGL